jgi:hypothetical protein
MKDTARVYFVRGLGELGLAILCILMLMLFFWLRNETRRGSSRGIGGSGLLVAAVLGIVVLIPRGVATISKSRQLAKFE